MPASHLVLAPGASGGVERLEPYRHALGPRGVTVTTIALPRGPAERAVPAYRRGVTEALGDTDGGLEAVAIGGHSFGGRVASLLAAEEGARALVLLSYPLHAPGRHEAWDARTAHWPAIRCPVLLLSGDADPFARVDLLRSAVQRLPDAELRTWPRLGHGLTPALAEVAEAIVSFLQRRT